MDVACAVRPASRARADSAPAVSNKLEALLKRELSRSDSVSISYAAPQHNDQAFISDKFANRAKAIFGKRIDRSAAATNIFTLTSKKNAVLTLTLLRVPSGDLQLKVRPDPGSRARMQTEELLPLMHAHLAAGAANTGALKFASRTSNNTLQLVLNGNKFELPKPAENAGGEIARSHDDDADGVLIEKPETPPTGHAAANVPVLVRTPRSEPAVLVRKPIAQSISDDFVVIDASEVPQLDASVRPGSFNARQ